MTIRTPRTALFFHSVNYLRFSVTVMEAIVWHEYVTGKTTRTDYVDSWRKIVQRSLADFPKGPGE